MILVSPAERRDVVRALERAASRASVEFDTSPLPERRGVDFLWRAQGRWWGCQRKTLPDLIASLHDGRLAKEIAQMRSAIAMPHLVVEGRITNYGGHVLTDDWGRAVPLDVLRKRLLTIGFEGVHISYTRDVADTADLVVTAWEWSQRANHSTAKTRPKPPNDWGHLSNRDFQVWLLQALPDVGPQTAEAILDTLGRCPLVLDATAAELLAVPGLGIKKVSRIIAALQQES